MVIFPDVSIPPTTFISPSKLLFPLTRSLSVALPDAPIDTFPEELILRRSVGPEVPPPLFV
jgi:hypothetical protein